LKLTLAGQLGLNGFEVNPGKNGSRGFIDGSMPVHRSPIDLMARYKSKADAKPKDRHIWSVDYG
jgi:hypothetical protein